MSGRSWCGCAGRRNAKEHLPAPLVQEGAQRPCSFPPRPGGLLELQRLGLAGCHKGCDLLWRHDVDPMMFTYVRPELGRHEGTPGPAMPPRPRLPILSVARHGCRVRYPEP